MSRAIQDIYPLTPTQRGMLFHSLHAAAPGVYVVQVAYTLRGELDEQAFATAWQTLVQRHDVLRTAFVWDKVEAPVQVVGTQARLPLEFLDWQTLTAAERSAQLADYMQADRRRGFELSSAPLMRVSCIRLAPAERRVIWTYHHLLLDGWSLPILMREWVAAYRAARRGASPALPPALPYRDYPAWLARCDQAAARAFWQDSLTGVEPAPPLLGSEAGGAGPVEATTQSVRRLAPALSAELTALARRERLTLSTLVQGAWALALARHAGGAQEVVYGLARAGRPISLPHFERRVGLFLNLLPMRVSTAGEHTVLAFLHALQDQQLAQQDYEFAALVDVHTQSGLPPTVPLFESVVVFENYPMQSAASLADAGDGELTLADVSVGEQTNYPLNLFAAAIGAPVDTAAEAPTETLELRILYAAARFSEAAIARLHAQLESLLTALAATPTARLCELPWLPAAEQMRVCRDWNRTRAPLPTTPVHAQIAARADAQPTACALSAGAQALDYAGLRGASAQLARHLLAAGVQPGQTVGVCLRRSPDLVIALLAVLEAGCAYVPLDPGYPAQRLRHVIEDAGLSRILVHDTTAVALRELALPATLLLNLDGAREAVARESVAPPGVAVAATDLAYLIYTSGSTGEPKGVAVSHGNLANLLAGMTARLALPALPTLLAVTTVAFDIAALELFLPLCTGGRLVLADEDTARDGQRLAALLAAERIDLMQATPSTWRLLLEAGWQGRAGLHLLCGGEALDAELAQRLLDCGAALWNVYGPTETTIWSSALALTPALLADGKVPIGAPLANTLFYVLDAAQRPVPLGAAGELYIGGDGLARGYHQRPALTRERFVDNPFVDEDDALPASPRLYRTGDRVRYREDGTLDYLGRFDQQVKLHGHRIELEEIERALTTHPAIEQAIVVVQAPGTAAARLAAFVRRATEATPADASLAAVLREHLAPLLPAYMVPGVYHAPAAFPLTHNGKIDRLALQRLQVRKARQGEAPQSGLERTVVEIWQAVLGVESSVGGIGVDDNFFELGGQSLLLINVQNRLRQTLAVELPLVELFRYPTPATLAAHLAVLSGDAAAAPAPVAQDRSAAREQGRQRQQQRLALRQHKA